MKDDPRAAKRAEKRLRDEILAFLKPRWRRCFWTWPFGHRYGDWVTTHSTLPSRISRCDHCDKPVRLDPFDAYDLLQLVEDLGEEAAYDRFYEKWRNETP